MPRGRTRELTGLVRPEVDDRALDREMGQIESSLNDAFSAAGDTLSRAIPGGSQLRRMKRALSGGGGGAGGGSAGDVLDGTIQQQQLDVLEDIKDELERQAVTAGGGGGGGGSLLPFALGRATAGKGGGLATVAALLMSRGRGGSLAAFMATPGMRNRANREGGPGGPGIKFLRDQGVLPEFRDEGQGLGGFLGNFGLEVNVPELPALKLPEEIPTLGVPSQDEIPDLDLSADAKAALSTEMAGNLFGTELEHGGGGDGGGGGGGAFTQGPTLPEWVTNPNVHPPDANVRSGRSTTMAGNLFGATNVRENRADRNRRQRTDVNVDTTVNVDGMTRSEVERIAEEKAEEVGEEVKNSVTGSGSSALRR